MIIFNIISLVEILVAGGIAAAIAGALTLFGLPFDSIFFPALFLIAAPIDLLWRLGQVFSSGLVDEEGEPVEEEEGSFRPFQLIAPRGGGHLFWLPVWALGALGGIAICGGWI